MKNEVRVLVWLIETRCPDLYKHIQSQRFNNISDNILEQANILYEEYEVEFQTEGLDQDYIYKQP